MKYLYKNKFQWQFVYTEPLSPSETQWETKKKVKHVKKETTTTLFTLWPLAIIRYVQYNCNVIYKQIDTLNNKKNKKWYTIKRELTFDVVVSMTSHANKTISSSSLPRSSSWRPVVMTYVTIRYFTLLIVATTCCTFFLFCCWIRSLRVRFCSISGLYYYVIH